MTINQALLWTFLVYDCTEARQSKQITTLQQDMAYKNSPTAMRALNVLHILRP